MKFHALEAAVMFNEFGVDGIETPVDHSELIGHTIPEIQHGVHEFAACRLVFHEEIRLYGDCCDVSLRLPVRCRA